MRRIKGCILNEHSPGPNECFASTGDECQLFGFASSDERSVNFFQAIVAANATESAEEEPATHGGIALSRNGGAMMNGNTTLKGLGIKTNKGSELFGGTHPVGLGLEAMAKD